MEAFIFIGQLLETIATMDITRAIAIVAIVLFGSCVMKRIFAQMKGGFGPFNLRITGIVIVATFASILAVTNPSEVGAAIGILGAIAGYLFGYSGKDSNKDNSERSRQEQTNT